MDHIVAIKSNFLPQFVKNYSLTFVDMVDDLEISNYIGLSPRASPSPSPTSILLYRRRAEQYCSQTLLHFVGFII